MVGRLILLEGALTACRPVLRDQSPGATDQTRAEQRPADQAPAEQTPAEQTPADRAPADSGPPGPAAGSKAGPGSASDPDTAFAPLLLQAKPKRRTAGSAGRRTRGASSTGRPVGTVADTSRPELLPTLRAAAPEQHARGRATGRLEVRSSDLRRATRIGRTPTCSSCSSMPAGRWLPDGGPGRSQQRSSRY